MEEELLEKCRILWQTQKFCFEHIKVEPKNIQVDILARQFDRWLWSLGENLGLEVEILESFHIKIILKHWDYDMI